MTNNQVPFGLPVQAAVLPTDRGRPTDRGAMAVSD